MEDKLTPEQRVRLEALAQSQQYFAVTMQAPDPETVLNLAQTFGEFIRTGARVGGAGGA